MKRTILLIVFTLSAFIANSQELNRIEINGKIIVESDDKEGITVYNASSNRGTTTNEKGEFIIKVAINDRIEFAALQFKDFEIIIDEKIMVSKQLTVILVEDINKLDEVLILPYDLSGNLEVDIESVKTFNPNMDAIYFGIQNVHEYQFADDHKSRTKNIAMHSQGQTMEYGANFVNILGALLKPLLKSNKSKEEKIKVKYLDFSFSSFKDYYSARFLFDNFGIPLNETDQFILYLEESGLDYSLLKNGKEMEFLEFVNTKSKLYLKAQSDKN